MVVADTAADETGDDRSFAAQRRRRGAEIRGAAVRDLVLLALSRFPERRVRLDADGHSVTDLQLPCPALNTSSAARSPDSTAPSINP